MTSKANRLLVFFLLFLAGSGVGFLVGGYTGSEFGMSVIANGTLNKDAADVKTHIEVLRLLRQNKSTEAIEIIEAYIDDALIIFDPQKPYPGLKDETVGRINEAISASYNYRLEYPRQSSRKHVDSMIENLFSRHRSKSNE